MRTITLRNLKPKSSFANVATLARAVSRNGKCLCRFTMGPAGRRQTFVASPNKPLATLIWEWSKSPASATVKRGPRKTSLKNIVAATAIVGSI